MFRRVFVLATIASLASTVSSHAEKTPGKVDPLKKLLEEKYAPPPTTTQKPLIYDKKDLQPAAPRPLPPTNRGGQLSPFGHPAFSNDLTAIDIKPLPVLFRLPDSHANDVSILFVADKSARPSASSNNIVVAQSIQRAPRYAIQFRPTTTGSQIDNLLRKFKLRPVKVDGDLHLMVVESLEPSGSLTDINPPIIRALRGEPIVARAFVDVPISARTVPRALNAPINSGGVNLKWAWNRPSGAAPNAPIPVAAGGDTNGNWGLTSIRMPPVWTIVQRYRAANPTLIRPKLAIVDRGFAAHEDLIFNLVPTGQEAAASEIMARLPSNCDTAHGNHIAGIVGATFNNGLGIDGIMRVDGANQQSNVDAVLWEDSLVVAGDPTASHEYSRTVLTSATLSALTKYLVKKEDKKKLVVNMSQGINLVARPVVEGDDPEKIPGAKEHLSAIAGVFGEFLSDYEDSILIIVAAGNDSFGRNPPLHTKWSHPLNWLMTGELPVDIRRPKNILIVEATDRNGQRADFSNVGGHVSAPGVDILSTLWPGDTPYGACPGTSMAAPHVAGVAALLFELDPSKKPSEIADIIKTSAIKQSKAPGTVQVPGAPRLDALEAVLKLSRDNLTRLADLNRDGKVDIEDMKIFAQHMTMIADNRAKGTAFTVDLNGDGVVDPNECNWPMIDLNGSGSASLSLTDAKFVQGFYRTDLDVMSLAWTDKTKDFKTALKETGLDVALQGADAPGQVIAAQACQ